MHWARFALPTFPKLFGQALSIAGTCLVGSLLRVGLRVVVPEAGLAGATMLLIADVMAPCWLSPKGNICPEDPPENRARKQENAGLSTCTVGSMRATDFEVPACNGRRNRCRDPESARARRCPLADRYQDVTLGYYLR